MNEFSKHEQQEKLSNQSTTEMPASYSSIRNPSPIDKPLTNNNHNTNRMYEDDYVVQAVQQWKLKTADYRDSSNNHNSPPVIDQPSSNINTTSNLSNHTDKNNNKDDLLINVDESSEKPISTMKKRVTPIPGSYTSRRSNRRAQSSNANLLTPHNKNKLGGKAIKKSTKSAPIFIPPKKPSHQSPSFSFDDSHQTKSKHILERQTTLVDDQNSSAMTNSTLTSRTRAYTQSSCSSLDENSSDESDHESLLIRKKNFKIKEKEQQFNSSFTCYFNIPSAILITDPYGHSHTFDPDNDIQEKQDNNEQIVDNNLNTSSPVDSSSPSEVEIVSHTLHSIGEEEEGESNHDDGIIFSKELDRIQASTRPHQTNSDVEKKDNDQIDKEPLGRRWSDGVVDQENEKISLPKQLLTKTASVASVIKSTVNPPVKMSRTKYILMKLHLTSSSKDDESNTPVLPTTTTTNPPRKQSNTKLSIKDDTNTHSHGSTSTLVPDAQLQQRQATVDSIQTANNSNGYDTNTKRQTKSDAFGSVGNLDAVDSDDDIDGTFEKAKLGSQSSINSVSSETKARYGLDISGAIELKLTYSLITGALDIFINKCINLARAKRNQTSDPFVKIYLLPDRSKNSKRKSATKKNTTDPVFEEKFRYHVTKQEFETRVIWISVWSQASFGQNDFLGEIHVPLANCTLDITREYQLLAQKKKNDLTPNIVPTMDPAEILFQLTFIEHPKHKEIGTLQVHYIEAKAIYYGRHEVDAICKGLLMPDKIKRKLPTIRKGPSPKWQVPLRWDGVRRDNLKNTSIELSIWCQERFKKFMYGFVRLNLAQGHFDSKPVTWLDSTKAEKAVWETFLGDVTKTHHFKLPLRPATNENK